MRDRSLGAVFDQVAETYDRVRPGYPQQLFNHLRSFAPDASSVLEVGAGTGKATVPLIANGYRVTCIEPGGNLIEVLRRNAPEAAIYQGTLEDWPLDRPPFDMLFSASAFQWVDPRVGPQKVHQALKPGGAVALSWNSSVETPRNEDFFHARQEVFRDVVPDMALVSPSQLNPDQMLQEVLPSFDSTGLFQPFEITRYPFEEWYDADGYADLLDSYSPFRVLPPAQQARLYDGMRAIINGRFGGKVLREYSAVLCLSRTKPAA